jgi:virginiamycin B lyase
MNITRPIARAALNVTLLLLASHAVRAQHMQQIPGATLSQLAVGSPWNIWGVNSAHQIFRFNSATHTFNQVSGLLVQIAVGGGNMQQPDAVWGVNSNQQIFQFSGGSWVQVSGLLTSISVGTGHGGCYPYEVWGVNSSHQVWRFNNCTGKWEVGVSGFSSVTSSGAEVWGIGTNGNVYRFNFSTLAFEQMPSTMYQLAITGGGGAVFGLHTAFPNPVIYEFNPGTQNWFQVPGTVRTLSAGGNEVWGINRSNVLLKLSPTSQTWTSFPGSYSQVIVGNGGGGVWTIDFSGNVYTFVTP